MVSALFPRSASRRAAAATVGLHGKAREAARQREYRHAPPPVSLLWHGDADAAAATAPAAMPRAPAASGTAGQSQRRRAAPASRAAASLNAAAHLAGSKLWTMTPRSKRLPLLLRALFPGSGVRAAVPVTVPQRWLRATSLGVETGSPTAAPVPVAAVSSAADSDVVFVRHGGPVVVCCPLTRAAIPPTQLCRNVHTCGHYYNHAALSGMLQQRRNRAKANARHSDPLDLARAHSLCPVAACESKLVSLSDVEMV